MWAIVRFMVWCYYLRAN